MLDGILCICGIVVRLQAGRSKVRISAEARDFSFLQNVQTGPAAHSAVFHGGKVTEACR